MALHGPKHLSPPSKRLYKRLATDFGLDEEPQSLEVLRLACEALDRCEEARQRVAADGAFVTDRHGQVKPHVGIAVERDARIAAMRAFRELSLDESVGDVRVPRTNGARS